MCQDTIEGKQYEELVQCKEIGQSGHTVLGTNTRPLSEHTLYAVHGVKTAHTPP